MEGIVIWVCQQLVRSKAKIKVLRLIVIVLSGLVHFIYMPLRSCLNSVNEHLRMEIRRRLLPLVGWVVSSKDGISQGFPPVSIHKKVHNSVKLDEIPDFISDRIYSPAGAVIFHQLLLSRNFLPFWWQPPRHESFPLMCFIREVF